MGLLYILPPHRSCPHRANVQCPLFHSLSDIPKTGCIRCCSICVHTCPVHNYLRFPFPLGQRSCFFRPKPHLETSTLFDKSGTSTEWTWKDSNLHSPHLSPWRYITMLGVFHSTTSPCLLTPPAHRKRPGNHKDVTTQEQRYLESNQD